MLDRRLEREWVDDDGDRRSEGGGFARSQFGHQLPVDHPFERTRDRDVVLVVSRGDASNPRAWSKRRRPSLLAEVEAGLAAAASKYRKIGKGRDFFAAGVPAFDFELERDVPVTSDDGIATKHRRERVVVRFLFFRTYTLVLTIAGPPKAVRAARGESDRVRASFSPPADYQP